MALDEDEKELLEKVQSKVGSTKEPFDKFKLAEDLNWEMNRVDVAMIELIRARIIENVDNGGRWCLTSDYIEKKEKKVP